MELLLRAGADEDHVDDKNYSSLYWSCFHGLIDVVDYLAEESEVLNTRTKCGINPLLICCKHGHTECVDILVRRGVQVNLCLISGEPLCNTSIKELPEMTHEREQTSSSSKPQNANRWIYTVNTSSCFSKYSTVLVAAQHGHVEICRLLLSAGVDTEVRDELGSTVLYHLVPYPDCVAILLNSGADANGLLHGELDRNIQPKNERQPVYRAVVENYSESLKILLQSNCSLTHEGNLQCRQKLPDAIVKGMLKCAKMLYAYSIISGCNMRWLESYLQSRPLQTLCNIRPRVALVRNWMLAKSRNYNFQPSLVRLCRKTIRDSMSSRNFKYTVKALPLPKTVQSFLMLSELDEIEL